MKNYRNKEAPELESGQIIVKAVQSKGNNLYSVEKEDGTEWLALLPNRMRSKVWVKRGSYLIVQNIEMANSKIHAEVVHLLNQDHVKQLIAEDIFPPKFAEIEKSLSESRKIDNYQLDLPPSDSENDFEEEYS